MYADGNSDTDGNADTDNNADAVGFPDGNAGNGLPPGADEHTDGKPDAMVPPYCKPDAVVPPGGSSNADERANAAAAAI